MAAYNEIDNSLGTMFLHWDSIAELEDTPVAARNEEQFKETVVNRAWSRDYPDAEWFGVRGGFEKVRKLCVEGWPEGRARGESLMQELEIPPVNVRSVRRRKVRRDSGDFLDIHRVYSGDISRAWESTQRDPGTMALGQNVRIVCAIAISASQSADDSFWNGAAAAVISDALQRSGRNVQVIAMLGVDGGSCWHPIQYLASSVTIKDFVQPMNTDVLFATLALSGFIRGYGFKMIAIRDSQIPEGWGHPHRPDAFNVPVWGSTDQTVFVQGCFSEARAREKIAEVTKHYGLA